MKDVNLLKSNGVNVDKSLDLFGDMDVYNDTLVDFPNEAKEKLGKLQEYKEAADMKNYAIFAHSLKSDARYFGFERLADLSYQHELESKANNMQYVYDNYDILIAEANRILKLVQMYLGRENSTDAGFEKEVVFTGKTILVVDDSNIVRNFVQKVFDNAFEVLVAKDGNEAIKIVESDVNNKIVAVLLDLNMPDIDGFCVLDYFKERNLFARIPVSIITGNDSKEVDQRAFQYPIVDMLKKPFSEKEIKRIVDRTLEFNNEN